MEKKFTFLIVDDQEIIREGLRDKLNSIFANCRVVEASDGSNCVNLVKDNSPDIVLMDISMPVCDGITATKNILSEFPEQKIIAFSMNDNDEIVNKMMKAGAQGYLLKTDDIDDFDLAISEVLQGRIFISRNIVK